MSVRALQRAGTAPRAAEAITDVTIARNHLWQSEHRHLRGRRAPTVLGLLLSFCADPQADIQSVPVRGPGSGVSKDRVRQKAQRSYITCFAYSWSSSWSGVGFCRRIHSPCLFTR